MKRKSTIWKMIAMIILIMFILGFKSESLATDINYSEWDEEGIIRVAAGEDLNLSEIISSAKSFIETPDKDADSWAITLAPIGQILVAVGIGALLLAGAMIGLKWMIAGPEERATLRGQIIGLLVAAVIIFGAVTIWRAVRSIGEKLVADVKHDVIIQPNVITMAQNSNMNIK